MDLSSPISSVIPSMDGAVLDVLARTNSPLTLTAIHRLIPRRGSLSGIRNSLVRLADHGLVDVVPGGYVLNREHLAAEAIVALTGLRAALCSRIGDHVAAWEPRPLLVGLFGSAARGDGDVHSDVDVLVVMAARDPEVGELAHAVERWTGNECHVVALTPTDVRRMRRAKESILASWNNELVVVTGDRHVLAGRA